jgi:hypothetical protein
VTLSQSCERVSMVNLPVKLGAATGTDSIRRNGHAVAPLCHPRF